MTREIGKNKTLMTILPRGYWQAWMDTRGAGWTLTHPPSLDFLGLDLLACLDK